MVGKRTLLWQYVVSYLAILFVPLFALAVITYQGMIGNLKRDLDARSLAEVQRIGHSMEADFEGMKRTTTQIANDPQLTRHQFASSEVSQLAAMAALKRYANANMVEQILIYYKGDDAIYSTNGMASLRAVVESSSMKGAWTYDRLYGALNATANAHLDTQTADGQTPRWFQYICPMISSTGTEYGKVVFTVKSSLFDRYLAAGPDAPASYFLLDDRGRVFYRQNRHALTDDEIRGIAAEDRGRGASERIYEAQGSGADLLVVSTSFPDAGWTLLMTLSSRQHYASYTRSVAVALVVFALVLAAALLLSYAMSKRNTNRIRKLLDVMTDRFSFAATGEVQQDELGMLRLVMESAADRMTDLEEKVDGMEARSTNESLVRFLTGKSEEDMPRSELYERSHLAQGFRECCALLISFVEKPNMPREALLYFLKEAVQFPETELCLVDMTPDPSIAVIVATNAGGAQLRKDLRAKIADLLEGKTGSQVRIAAGGLHPSLDDLPASFQEAQVELHERIATDGPTIAGAGEGDAPAWLPDAQLKLLHKHILAGDGPKIDRAVEALERLVFHELPPGALRRSALFEVYNTLIKLSVKADAGMGFAQMDALLCAESGPRFAAQVGEFCHRMALALEDARGRELAQLRRSILAYAEANYADANFSLVSIGLQFNVSLSYLSKLFKEETGETFTDYMTRLRIDRCKELLVHTDAPIKDIVQEIGYLDVSNFIRKFRTRENMTPGRYREAMRQGEGGT